MNKVVAISRQYGSAGRKIGLQLAERLGIKFYDSFILDEIAEKTGFDKNYLRENGEYTSSGNWLLSAISGRDLNGHNIKDDIWQIQRGIIIDLAKKSSCVIIGRCADYILQDIEDVDVLSVFVHADDAVRIDRAVNELHEIRENENPAKKIREMDKRRRAYCQLYTDIRWGEAQYYDICLDSGRFGVTKCVDILEELYLNDREGKS